MAFIPRKFDTEEWLILEDKNLLQKICDTFDTEGRLIERRKTRVDIFPAGSPDPQTGRLIVNAPALRRIYDYDEFDNVTARVPDIVEWTQACEDKSNGQNPDAPIDFELIPRGLLMSPISVEYGEASSVVPNVETLLLRITVQPDELIYVQSVELSGENRGQYSLKVDGDTKYKKRTYWTDYNTRILSNTDTGGIIIEEASTISVYVTNRGDEPADFNASINYLKKVL